LPGGNVGRLRSRWSQSGGGNGQNYGQKDGAQ